MTHLSQSWSQLQLRVSAAAGSRRDALTPVNARRDLECIYSHSTRLPASLNREFSGSSGSQTSC